jgi:hypothetical protein
MVDQAKKQQAERLVARGVAALKARDPQRAQQFLLEARKLDPENTDALLWLTSTTRDPGQRRQILEQVLRIDPGHAQALRALAKLEGQSAPLAQPEAATPASSESPAEGVTSQSEEATPPAPEAPADAIESSGEAVGTVEEMAEDAPQPEAPAQETTPEAEGGPSSLLSRLEPADEEAQEAVPPSPVPTADEMQETAPPLAEVPLEAAQEEAPVTEQPPEAEAPKPEAASTPVVEETSPAEPEAPQIEPEPTSAASAVPAPASPDQADLQPPSVQEMVTQAEASRCPRCGAVMRVREGTTQTYCVFCGYGMEDEAESEATTEVAPIVPEQIWAEARQSRHCLNCGTHSIPPGGQEGALCPLCQQSIFEPSEPVAAQPDVFLPFKLNEAEAAIAIEDEARGGLRRLLGGKVEMTRPRRVLLPVWVFNGKAHIDPGQGVETFTETYRLVPVHTLPQMDSQLLRVASAVPFEEVQPYRAEVIQGAYVLLPSQPFQACVREVRALIERDAREKAQAQLRKAGTLRSTGLLGARPVEIQDLVQRLVLLPVWINEIREGGRLRAGMVNAYTGAVVVGNMVHRQHGR